MEEIYKSILTQGGIVGAFLLLFLFGKIRREDEVRQKDNEIAELKKSVKELTEHYQKELLPALIEATKVSGEYVLYLNKRRN
jgi:hypothetical protein